MRQHLTCVKASAEVSQAQLVGAELHSTDLEFVPGAVQAGEYHFAIGSAGSTTLVFQTLLPALMLADKASELRIQGGTHNPLAPSADYLKKVFLPAAKKLGVEVEVTCERVGFAPAGGGVLLAEIAPSVLKVGNFLERGTLLRRELSAMVANLSGGIMLREVEHAERRLGWPEYEREMLQITDADGSGNCFAIQLDYEHVSERFTEYGKHGMSAERVSGRVVKEVKDFLSTSEYALGEHLADQILLPIALAGKGVFTTSRLTSHLRTNISVIQQFLDLEVKMEHIKEGVLKVEIG